ncbi:MAG: MFS transporter [Chloroflexi bacterium]|nr:MFS transporter [Chloroflexota bacterium]
MNTSRFFYGYWIILTGFVTLTLNWGFGFYGFSVLNKPIASEFTWSRTEVATAFLVFCLAAAAISPAVGRLTDWHGPRRVLLAGTIVMSLSLFLLSRTSAIWNFYLLHLFLGFGWMLIGPVPVSAAVTNWFSRRRGTMQGLAFIGIGFGGLALAPLIGNYLVPGLGWRGAYLIMASALLAVMLPMVFIIVRDYPRAKGLRAYGDAVAQVPSGSASRPGMTAGLNLKEGLGTGAFWIAAVTFAIYGLANTAAVQNQVSILSEHGFATTSAVVTIGIVGLSSAAGKFFFGYLCDRISPKYAAGLSFSFTASALIVIIQAYSLPYVWLYSVLIGLGQGGWAPNMAMLVASFFGLKHYGALQGALYLAFLGGSAVGPVIAGFVYDRTGSYYPVLLTLSILCFASIPLIATIRKHKSLRG